MKIDVTPTIINLAATPNEVIFDNLTGKDLIYIMASYSISCYYTIRAKELPNNGSILWTPEEFTKFLPNVKVSEFITKLLENHNFEIESLKEWKKIIGLRIPLAEKAEMAKNFAFNFLYYKKKEAILAIDTKLKKSHAPISEFIFYKIV